MRQGESPRWDGRDGSVLWVDLRTSRLHIAAPEAGSLRLLRSIEVPGGIGSAAPLPGADAGWIMAGDGAFAHVSATGRVRAVVSDLTPPGTFFNDGIADHHGRFWAGTQSVPREPTSALFSLERDGTAVQRLAGLTVSNGIAFSDGGRVMYFIDTLPHRRLEAFDVDADGTLSGRRTVATIPDGNPDGIAVDDEGAIWVAVWGTGEVRRFTPDGDVDFVVRADAPLVSAVALVDDLLVVTTAQDPEGREDHATAGMIFTARVPFRGLPTFPWRPDGDLLDD